MEIWKVGAISLIAAVAVFLAVPSISNTPLNPRPTENPCAGISPAMAELVSRYESPTPYERFEAADLVVIGTITDSTARCDGMDVRTYMDIEIEESLKNPQNLSTVTVKMYGGTIGDYSLWVEDQPNFKTGDRVFLYLDEDDDAYGINHYSGVLARDGLPDYSVSGEEILETFRLEFNTNGGNSIDIQPGEDKEVTLNLTSYFGYDSPTHLKVSSFARLTDSGVFNSANLTRLAEFGLSMEPAERTITPPVNGTGQETYVVKVSENALPGTYYIFVSSAEEDVYSPIAGGLDDNYVSINVPENDPDA